MLSRNHVISCGFFLLALWLQAQKQVDFKQEVRSIDQLIDQKSYAAADSLLNELRASIVNTSYETQDSVQLYFYSKLAFVNYQMDSCKLATQNSKNEANLRFKISGFGDLTALRSLRNLGIYYLNCGTPEKADSALMKVVQYHEQYIHQPDELYVRTLEDLAFAKGKLDQPDLAISTYDHILEILGSSNKSSFYYHVLENYSTLLINEELFEEASPFYDELKDHMSQRPDNITFLRDYYNVFVHLKDYKKAFETASMVVQECKACKEVSEVDFKLNSARLAVLLGKYNAANEYYNLAQRDYRDSLQAQIQILLERADVDGYLNNRFNQIGRLKRCRDIHERNNITDSASYTRTILELGHIYTELGKFEEAERLFTGYITELERDAGTKPERLAQAYQSLGNQKYLLRDFNGADLYLNKSRDILITNSLKNTREYASILNSLGALNEAIANYDLAKKHYREGLRSVTLDEAGLALSVALAANLANILNSTDPNNDSIEQFLNKAVGWQRAITGETHPDFANLLNKRGLHYQDKGDLVSAERDYLDALAILEYIVGKSHPEYLTALSNLGLLYNDMERNDDGLEKMLEAKSLYEEYYSNDNPGYVLTVNNLANLYTKLERFEEAEPLFLDLADIELQEIRESFTYLSEDEKKKFVAAKRKFQDNLKRYIITRFTEDEASVRPDIISKWYELELNMKGILLNSTKRVRDQLFKSGDQALIDLFSEWSLARKQVADMQSLKSEHKENETYMLDSLTRKITALEKEISRASASFSNSFASEELNFETIRNSLEPDECSLEVIRTEINGEGVYTALLVLPNAAAPELILIGTGEDLEKKAFPLYKNTIRYKIENTQPYEAYWKPIDERISGLGIQRIYYSPDGVYHKISVATLYNGVSKSYLLEEYEVFQLTSTKDIIHVKSMPEAFSASKMLLLGRPSYKFGEVQETTASNVPVTRAMESLQYIPDLPGTETEINEISKTIGSSIEQTRFLGDQSTENNFKSNLDNDIIHIATHGFFMEKSRVKDGVYLDPMLYSGLLLAGVSDFDTKEKTGEDGILTAYEIMNLEFSSLDMIVLSACETGTGEVSSGEGVYGLQRAFFVAGTNTLVMSLWKVDDAATRDLMTAFYKGYVKSGNKREAFLAAQKKMQKKYKSPIYWGAFVMVGG